MTNSERDVLIVDDDRDSLEILENILALEYDVAVAVTGRAAVEIAKDTQPLLILLDVNMSDLSGFEVCRQLKGHPKTSHIPIIFVTALGAPHDEALGFKLGAVDYIHKPISAPIVLARVKTHLDLDEHRRNLEQMVEKRTAEVRDTQLEIIRRLSRAAELKDNETGKHVIRMSHYSQVIGKAAELSPAEVELILQASPMHDVGKIGVPDEVLNKTGKLTDDDWVKIRRHPELGAEILGHHDSPLLQAACEIALTHHEKWNGTGYPRGLSTYQIPLFGRITAIADVFDALTSKRPYKEAFPFEDAVQIITDGSGQHFDPNLVDCFLSVLPEIQDLMIQHAEEQAK